MSKKNTDYYMNLAYVVRIHPEPDGSGYTAEIPDLPGCITCAGTLDELWEMVEDAKHTWIEGSLAEGLSVPEPTPLTNDRPSGKFTVRMPRSLHRKLANQAEQEGVSLNQLINVTMAESVGMRRAGRV